MRFWLHWSAFTGRRRARRSRRGARACSADAQALAGAARRRRDPAARRACTASPSPAAGGGRRPAAHGPSVVVSAVARRRARRLKAGEYEFPQRRLHARRRRRMVESGRVRQHPVLHPEGATVSELARRSGERAAGARRGRPARRQRSRVPSRAHGIEGPSAGRLPVPGYLPVHPRHDGGGDARPHDPAHAREAHARTSLARARARGLTMHKLLTLASIIEREAAVAESSGRSSRPCSGTASQIDMPLQADPTVQYAVAKERRHAHPLGSGQTDHPYNTYRDAGLPPGPIASPGMGAIEAAARSGAREVPLLRRHRRRPPAPLLDDGRGAQRRRHALSSLAPVTSHSCSGSGRPMHWPVAGSALRTGIVSDHTPEALAPVTGARPLGVLRAPAGARSGSTLRSPGRCQFEKSSPTAGRASIGSTLENGRAPCRCRSARGDTPLRASVLTNTRPSSSRPSHGRCSAAPPRAAPGPLDEPSFARVPHRTLPGPACGAALRASGFDLRVEGLEHLPADGPYIVAANHHNYLDGVVLGVARAAARRVPRHAARLARDAAAPAAFTATSARSRSTSRGPTSARCGARSPRWTDGRVVGIFPEGPFSVRGRLEPGLPGVGLLALRSGVPVVPAGIRGTYAALVGRRVYVPRRHPLAVRFGPPRRFAREGRRAARAATHHAADHGRHRRAPAMSR